jgi:hypothetical protein
MLLHLKRSLAVIAALSWLAGLAAAQSQSLDIRPFAKRIMGDDIAAHFSGKTHAGAYNFSRGGDARDFYTERHNEDGTVFYKEGNTSAHGRWGVFNDVLCYYYVESQVSGGCFRVYRVENCYYFYSDNLPDDPDEIEGDFWTARSTLKGERQKCEAAIS